MTRPRDPGKSNPDDPPYNTPDPPAPLPMPPANERLRDFEPEADTVRIERLTDQRGGGRATRPVAVICQTSVPSTTIADRGPP